MTPPHDGLTQALSQRMSQRLSPIGRRRGSGFFGAGFFRSGPGSQCFLTGASLRKDMEFPFPFPVPSGNYSRPTGRLGSCFFGWCLQGCGFGSGAGLRVFFTGTILWKLTTVTSPFVAVLLPSALFAFDMENITGFPTQKKPIPMRPE